MSRLDQYNVTILLQNPNIWLASCIFLIHIYSLNKQLFVRVRSVRAKYFDDLSSLSLSLSLFVVALFLICTIFRKSYRRKILTFFCVLILWLHIKMLCPSDFWVTPCSFLKYSFLLPFKCTLSFWMDNRHRFMLK